MEERHEGPSGRPANPDPLDPIETQEEEDSLSPEVQVTQGQIHVEQIWMEARGPNFYIFRGVLKAKRAEVIDPGHEVCLYAVEDTLHTEETEEMTLIRFPDLQGWDSMAEVNRYTVTIAFWRPPPSHAILWTAPEAPTAP